MSIAVSQLTRTYGEQKAIDGLTFSLSRGEIVGFLGPNGAGKSTTMKVLTGCLPPSGGRASICGLDVEQHPLETKRKTGYLPESNPLYPEMYVRESLAFTAGLYGMRRAGRRIAELIEMTGLGPEQHKKIGALSKGYRQRVGLAQALLHDPEVLILDEPTSGLDPNQLSEVRQLIRDLGRDKTVLFSSHILQEVQALCDRVIIIHQGHIVADDRLSRLSRQGESTTLTIVFAEAPPEDWMQGLAAAGEARRLDPLRWALSTAHPEELKKNLWATALENNLNIVSLQSDTPTLEDVFRRLTTGQDPPGAEAH